MVSYFVLVTFFVVASSAAYSLFGFLARFWLVNSDFLWPTPNQLNTRKNHTLEILEFMLLATSLVESIKMCVCKINRSIMCGWGEVQQKSSNLYDLGWRTDHRCPDPYPDQLSTLVHIWKWMNWKALFQLQSQKDVALNICDQ